MSTYGDPMAGIIVDALVSSGQEIESYSATIPVVHGGGLNGDELDHDASPSAHVTPSYPKFEAAYSSYTFQSYADIETEPKTRFSSWKTQIGVPSSPAVFNGLGLFTNIPPNAQDALTNVEEKSDFVLIDKHSKAGGNVIHTIKLTSSETCNFDGYRTPSPSTTPRFPAFGSETVKPITPTKLKTSTGFTPLVEQTEQFSAQRTLILESPAAKKSARKQKRTEQAKRAAADEALERPQKIVRSQAMKVTLTAFNQDQAKDLLANIPSNPEYDIEVVLCTNSAQASQCQQATHTPAAPVIDFGSGGGNGPAEPCILTPAPQSATTFEEIAQFIHLDPASRFIHRSPKVKLLIHPDSDSPFRHCNPKFKLFIRPAQSPSIAATEFLLFSKLPTELQLVIWEYALPDRRSVKLSFKRDSDKAPPTQTPVPAILHACQAARKVALKTLLPSFQSTNDANQYTYFNPRIDTLELSLLSARYMAHITGLNTNIGISRRRTEHVCIPFRIYASMPMYQAIAELVLASPYNAWPAIKSWHLPSMHVDKHGDVDETQVIEKWGVSLSVKMPETSKDSENKTIVSELAVRIKNKINEGRKMWGRNKVLVGIRITYD